MKAMLALGLVACQRTEPPPTVASGSSPAPSIVLVGCAPAGERPRVARAAEPRSPGEPEVLPMLTTGWFPYAQVGAGDDERAAPVAAAARAALAARLVDLDLCLTGKTGSVSVMLQVTKDGAVAPRVGGIGHRPTGQCVADVVKKLKLPPAEVLVRFAARDGVASRAASRRCGARRCARGMQRL